MPIKNIILSRTDSIGDVVLTLPMAKFLKDKFPDIKIGFLGKSYTKPIIEACVYVDVFIDLNDFLNKPVSIFGEPAEAIIHVFPVSAIAKRAAQLGIKIRIGTTNRLYHWLYCNRFVKLSRKNSDLHEAQLNLKLLSSLGISNTFSLKQISTTFGLQNFKILPAEILNYVDDEKINIILHPKSQGSGKEWPLSNYIQLINLLDKSKYKIFISGTENERALLTPLLEKVGSIVVDIIGKMTLADFLIFINSCDVLVACSTGPLHIAAALGKNAIGIYPPIKPIHPGRWGPVGLNAKVFVKEKPLCKECRNIQSTCACMAGISAENVYDFLTENAVGAK